MLFGCYRRGDANDPETYVAAVAAVLAMYDPAIIREVTDPRSGIQTTEKFASWMPNAGELKIHCDGVAAYRERLDRLRQAPPVLPVAGRIEHHITEPPPGHHANLFVPDTHDRYAALIAWTVDGEPKFWRAGKSSDGRNGMWVAAHIWDKLATRKGAA